MAPGCLRHSCMGPRPAKEPGACPPRPTVPGHLLHHLPARLRGLARCFVEPVGLAGDPAGLQRRDSPGARSVLFPRDQVVLGALQPARRIRPGSRGDPGLPAASRQAAAGSVWVPGPGAGWRLAGRSGCCCSPIRRSGPLAALVCGRSGALSSGAGSVAAAAGPVPRRRPRSMTILNPIRARAGGAVSLNKGLPNVGPETRPSLATYDGVNNSLKTLVLVPRPGCGRCRGLALKTDPAFTTANGTGPGGSPPASAAGPSDQPAVRIGLALVRRQALGGGAAAGGRATGEPSPEKSLRILASSGSAPPTGGCRKCRHPMILSQQPGATAQVARQSSRW